MSSLFRLAEFIRGLHVVAVSLHVATMGLRFVTIGLQFVDVFRSVIVLVCMIFASLLKNVEQSSCSTHITHRVIYFFSCGGEIWLVIGESIRLGAVVRGVF